MSKFRQVGLYLLIVILVISDQLIKYIVVSNLNLYEKVTVIKGFFYITLVKNTGGAFSLFAQRSWGIYVLSILSIIIVIVLLVALHRMNHGTYKWVRIAIAVLCGGAIGNLIDRIFQGAVVDYLMFVFGSYTFPIFNLADICIVISSLFLAVMLIFDKKLLHQDVIKSDEESVLEDSCAMDQQLRTEAEMRTYFDEKVEGND